MTCPKCGAEMNHQADKLVHPDTAEEAAAMTAALDGVIEEVYACRACGWIESRRASGS
jgi:rubredoxin